jgi:hypothetical protein
MFLASLLVGKNGFARIIKIVDPSRSISLLLLLLLQPCMGLSNFTDNRLFLELATLVIII